MSNFEMIDEAIKAERAKNLQNYDLFAGFDFNKYLTTVDLRNDKHKTIGSGRYSNRTVCQLWLGSSVEEIGRQAFFNADKLKDVYIPENVKVIEFGAFDTDSLESVVVEDSKRKSVGLAFPDKELEFEFKHGDGFSIETVQPEVKNKEISYTILCAFSNFVERGFKMDEFAEVLLHAYQVDFTNISVLYSMTRFVLEFNEKRQSVEEESIKEWWISNKLTRDEALGECESEEDMETVRLYYSMYWDKKREDPLQDPPLMKRLKEERREKNWEKTIEIVALMTKALREYPQRLYLVLKERGLYDAIPTLFDLEVIDEECARDLVFLSSFNDDERLETSLLRASVSVLSEPMEEEEESLF